MRTKTTLAVRLVTRVTRVTRVDSPKTLLKVKWRAKNREVAKRLVPNLKVRKIPGRKRADHKSRKDVRSRKGVCIN